MTTDPQPARHATPPPPPADFPVTLDGPLLARLTTVQAARLRQRIRETVMAFLEEAAKE